MAKWIAATTAEKDAYDGEYPLSGWVTDVDGCDGKLPVERKPRRLGQHPDDMRMELLLPPHYQSAEGCHTILAFDRADLLSRLPGIEECPEDCDCRI